MFYGFKPHLICNDRGEIPNFMITPGDVDDRDPLKMKSFVEFIYGKLVGDKKYIGKDLFNKLFIDGIQLITKLNNIAQIEHTRLRSFPNFAVYLLAGIAAYCLFPKKPTINRERVYENQLTNF